MHHGNDALDGPGSGLPWPPEMGILNHLTDDQAGRRSSNPWEWLVFMAVTVAASGSIVAGVRWWTTKWYSDLAARLEELEKRLSVHERVMDAEGSTTSA